MMLWMQTKVQSLPGTYLSVVYDVVTSYLCHHYDNGTPLSLSLGAPLSQEVSKSHFLSCTHSGTCKLFTDILPWVMYTVRWYVAMSDVHCSLISCHEWCTLFTGMLLWDDAVLTWKQCSVDTLLFFNLPTSQSNKWDVQILTLLLDLRVDGSNRLGVVTGGSVVYSCHVIAKEPPR